MVQTAIEAYQWIPAFAGMTGVAPSATGVCRRGFLTRRNLSGERFIAEFSPTVIPSFRGRMESTPQPYNAVDYPGTDGVIKNRTGFFAPCGTAR